MTTGSTKPTLAEHLGGMQLGKLVQNKLLGGYEVSLLPFLHIGLWLFNNGAVFGRARRDKIEIISKMFVGSDTLGKMFEILGISKQAAYNQQSVSTYICNVGSDGSHYYFDIFQKEPESLLDLWLKSFTPPDVDFRDIKKAKMLAKKKLRLGGCFATVGLLACYRY